MNNFLNYQGFQVTVQTINFEPWFLAKDIANILMLKNPSMMIRHAKISKDFVRKIATNTLGGKQKMLYINRKALEGILDHSKRDKASHLRHWIQNN